MNIELLAVLISALSSIIAALLTGIFSKIKKFKIISHVKKKDVLVKTDYADDSRLTEAKELLRQQEIKSKLNKGASNFLSFSQYVIGGILASSFIQQSLSKEIVGIFGVLVLFSSLVNQKYRPDVQYRSYLSRCIELKKLIRQAEDNIFALEKNIGNASPIHDIRAMISNGLADIERLELEDIIIYKSNIFKKQ